MEAPHVHTTIEGRQKCKKCPPWDVQEFMENLLRENRQLRKRIEELEYQIKKGEN